MKLWTWVLAALMLLAGFNAEAARFGGGRSFGRQSSNVMPRQAAPRPPAAAPAAAPAGVAPKRPWGAMLGGLAAGLGLAWLANSMGLGGAFGQIMMLSLIHI